jgi:large subunit ribosomal protein L4
MHQVVKMQLANKRQGTQSALTRAEVRGGGAKPWRQKGTGRARHGSIRSPIWRKGGVVFAPKPRSYRYSLPKKVRRLAMKSALSSKVNEEAILVLDSLELKEAKTKEMAKVLDNFNINKKALIVLEGKNETVERAARNIPGVKLAYVNTLNVLDILNYDNFVITQDAVKKVEEVYV